MDSPEERVPVFYSNMSTISDAASDSEESTVNIRETNKISLYEQLSQARLEIQELKRMLAEKV
jgi:hypothetical protein